MARSTRLVILIKNIYTLWGRKRFLLPVTYFPKNLVYPFTLRVTGIINEWICESKADGKSIKKESINRSILSILSEELVPEPKNTRCNRFGWALGASPMRCVGNADPRCWRGGANDSDRTGIPEPTF